MNELRKLTIEQLKALAKVDLKGLPAACVASIGKNIIAKRPDGTSMDWFDWGFQKGLYAAHEMYRDLAVMAQKELEERAKIVKVDSTVD